MNYVVELRPTDSAALDVAQSSQLFAMSFSLVLVCFIVSLGVGAIVRVIRSA